MSDDLKFNIKFGLACLLGAILCYLPVALLSRAECNAQWERSGFQHSWGPIQGCMIRREDGTWIPAEAYREVSK